MPFGHFPSQPLHLDVYVSVLAVAGRRFSRGSCDCADAKQHFSRLRPYWYQPLTRHARRG